MKVNKKPRAVSLNFHPKCLGSISDLLTSFVSSVFCTLQDYSAWAELEKLGALGYVTRNTLSHAFYFVSKVSYFPPVRVLCHCLKHSLGPAHLPSLAHSWLRILIQINRGKKKIWCCMLLWVPPLPLSNTPSCIVLKKDCIYCVVNFSVSHCKTFSSIFLNHNINQLQDPFLWHGLFFKK